MIQDLKKISKIKDRFDGYLPIVIDLETAGVNPLKHALLELAAVLLDFDEQGLLTPIKRFSCHILPFEGSVIDPAALAINRIDPYHPFRFAVSEQKALEEFFAFVHTALAETGCRRAVLVGHNAHFDLSFLQAALLRNRLKKNPFHAFTCFDTATLSALMFGKTVLAKALRSAGIAFNKEEAHSAIYDAEKTAELFCYILNQQLESKPII